MIQLVNTLLTTKSHTKDVQMATENKAIPYALFQTTYYKSQYLKSHRGQYFLS